MNDVLTDKLMRAISSKKISFRIDIVCEDCNFTFNSKDFEYLKDMPNYLVVLCPESMRPESSLNKLLQDLIVNAEIKKLIDNQKKKRKVL